MPKPGRGAYGVVYKAIDATTGDFVAIKVISLVDSDATDLERIEQEVGFLQECNHPNVVSCLDTHADVNVMGRCSNI